MRLLAVVEWDGEQHIVMDYVGGGSLRDLLRAQGPLTSNHVLQIGLELSDALARAHHLHTLHRDLEPESVLLAQDGTPRLSDFELARSGDMPLTPQAPQFIGSVARSTQAPPQAEVPPWQGGGSPRQSWTQIASHSALSLAHVRMHAALSDPAVPAHVRPQSWRH